MLLTSGCLIAFHHQPDLYQNWFTLFSQPLTMTLLLHAAQLSILDPPDSPTHVTLSPSCAHYSDRSPTRPFSWNTERRSVVDSLLYPGPSLLSLSAVISRP